MYPRIIEPQLLKLLRNKTKSIILYGPRQVGKTTLLEKLIGQLEGRVFYTSGDNFDYMEILSSRKLSQLSPLIADYDYICVDEAHKIPHFATSLKLMIDTYPHKCFFVTGSNALELRDHMAETLAGRIYSFELWPLWVSETFSHLSQAELNIHLDELLVYGSYPGVFTKKSHSEKELELKSIIDRDLIKDTLYEKRIEKELLLRQLMRLLAYQIGQQVSYRELAGKLGVRVEQVQGMIDALERSYIIFRLTGYSRNLRNEVVRNPKIYFYDVGIRNGLIGAYDKTQLRNDIGQIWENFIIAERKKKLVYKKDLQRMGYFWRLYTGAEIDYVEESGVMPHGYEIKWGKSTTAPFSWNQKYPNATYECITRLHWKDFVM
jgi:predicted AAA+ superfamily ATPase